MKKHLFVLLFVLLVCSVCGFGNVVFGAENSILYHVHTSIPYVTLDPSIEYSNGIMVLQNVYETLPHYAP